MQQLAGQLNELCASAPYRIGWSVRHFPSGWSANREGDTVFPSMSTRKVAILMQTFKGVNEGRFSLEQPIRLDKVNQDSGGVFQYLSRGLNITLHDALVMMIIVSDNTCTSHVASLVGLDKVNALCKSVGMKGTSHRQNVPPDDQPRNPDPSSTNATTPNDQVLLLDLIVEGVDDKNVAAKLGCTSAQCQHALEIMSWQKSRSRIPCWLPEGTKVANKTGTHAGALADIGVIYQDGCPPYCLTIFTAGVPEAMPDGAPGVASCDQLMGKLSRLCWDTFTGATWKARVIPP